MHFDELQTEINDKGLELKIKISMFRWHWERSC